MTNWKQITYRNNEKIRERIISDEIFWGLIEQAAELRKAGEDITLTLRGHGKYELIRKLSDRTVTTWFEKIEEPEKTTIGFSIYQLPRDHDNIFMCHDWAMNHGGINYREYETVYTGEIPYTENPNEMLEQIYTIFNTDHPADYRGRSLSVSDLVVLEETGTYFCDSIGWKQLN